MKIKKEYKAMELYELSKKEGSREYNAFVNTSKKIIVRAFVLDTPMAKKKAMAELSSYKVVGNLPVKNFLDNNYVVGLFDETNKNIFFLQFGTVKKDLLEKFHQKITSGKFKSLFETETEVKDLQLEEKKVVNKGEKKKGEYSYEEAVEFVKELQYIGPGLRQRIIQDEEKFNLTLYTLGSKVPTLKSKKEVREILETLNKLNIPAVQNLRALCEAQLSK